MVRTAIAPKTWKNSCVHTECTFHQLSPYIGKIKSNIATKLIKKYSRTGDLIVDPFCGSGTIPFEAAMLGRKIFASDTNPYSILLTKAKLNPPASLDAAISKFYRLLKKSNALPDPDLREVPRWVRSFFHPKTLKEILNFIEVSQTTGNEFYLSCLMGILHHQRPGFLSYPSSHLVPYLRDKKYPKKKFPELFEYRSLEDRMLAKIERSFKRCDFELKGKNNVRNGKIENINLPIKFDCVITSPPYMNALDYERDNRLRIWFLTKDSKRLSKIDNTTNKDYFETIMRSLFLKVNTGLRKNGKLVLILGNTVDKGGVRDLVEPTKKYAKLYAPKLQLISNTQDDIPDIRRARRAGNAVRKENILVFKKVIK